MASSVVAVLLFQFLLVVTALLTVTQAHDWAHEIPLKMGKQKITKLHFFYHDIVSGKNPTAVQVGQAPSTNTSSTMFGALYLADDPLTVGPLPTSKLVGRAQGMYGYVGQKEMVLLMSFSYIFTDRKFRGSSINVLTRNPITHRFREFPIVGGTGVFRFARGVVFTRPYWVNFKTGDAIVEYNVTVLHY